MALKATKDTYGFEMIGGVEVRRLIKAGDNVPPTYRVEDSDVEEVDAGVSSDKAAVGEPAGTTADKKSDRKKS